MRRSRDSGTLGTPGWATVSASEPGLVVASAAWVEGAPATGGLRQRLVLARNSLLGTQHAPVVMSVAWRPGRAISEAEIRQALGEVDRFVAAQPDLSATLASVTGG